MKKAENKIKILIIGSGNIAWHLVSHLSFFKRFEISVFSRTKNQRALTLKKEFKINIVNNWSDLKEDYHLIFICSGDNSIAEVAGKLIKLKSDAVIVHTSGTTPLSAIKKTAKNTGVFYPLQTFTFGKSVDWQEVPVFIEGNNKSTAKFLTSFAELFTKKVVPLNSNERLKIHLSAVIAGNFSNAMFAAAYDFLQKENKSNYFQYLTPLILNTARKASFNIPAKVQTGPAARNDKKTITKHLSLLKKHPDIKKLYRNVTKLIIKQQKKHA